MVAIPWPTSSSPGKRPHNAAGRLINAQAVPLVVPARAKDVIRRTPGLKAWSAASGQTGNRGSILVGSTLYSGFSGNVTRFDSAGAKTSVGSLTGTKKLFWARNNKATPDIVAVDPDNGAFTVTSGSVVSFADPDLPAANSVCFQDGYFFFTIGDGRCFASGLNSVSINAATFITCEGKPDGLWRAIAFGQLYLCGDRSIEVWQDTAEAPPGFPYSRVKVIPKGLIGRYAVSGFEDGIDQGLLFVGNDRVCYALNGYQPTKISSPDVDSAIGSYLDAGGDPDGIEMFPYVVDGITSVVLKTASWTWVYDLDNLRWHERRSYLAATWRATASVNAFGKWLCGDTKSGNLIEITDKSRNEVGDPLVWTVESAPASAFPNRVAVAQATFDLAQGVGVATGSDPTQTKPRVAIEWSDDGGTAWSTARLREIGRQSLTADPVRLVKTGMTKTMGRRWRLTVSDDVDVELTGGDMLAEVRT